MAGFDRIVVLDPGLPAAVVETGHCPTAHYPETKSIVCGAWMVMHFKRGEGLYLGPGWAQPLRPGTILSLPPGRRDFEVSADHDVTILAMREPPTTIGGGFTFPLVRQLTPFESRRWAQRVAETAHEIVTHRFDEARAEAFRDELFELRWIPAHVNGRHTVEEALQAMAARFQQPIRLGELARDHGYTANYLNDLTRIHTGRSLGRWLGDIRMSRARDLLTRTEMPIADVAADCGYDDPAYFSRAFRRAHDLAPGTWRLAHRPADARHAELIVTVDEFRRAEPMAVVSL